MQMSLATFCARLLCRPRPSAGYRFSPGPTAQFEYPSHPRCRPPGMSTSMAQDSTNKQTLVISRLAASLREHPYPWNTDAPGGSPPTCVPGLGGDPPGRCDGARGEEAHGGQR